MLRAFIDYGAENYPADKYDLILISHGGGPASGWGMDAVFEREDGKKIMSTSEICGAPKNSDVKHNEAARAKENGDYTFYDEFLSLS